MDELLLLSVHLRVAVLVLFGHFEHIAEHLLLVRLIRRLLLLKLLHVGIGLRTLRGGKSLFTLLLGMALLKTVYFLILRN